MYILRTAQRLYSYKVLKKNRFAKEINSVATIILFHFRPGNVEKMKNKKRNRKEGNSQKRERKKKKINRLKL